MEQDLAETTWFDLLLLFLGRYKRFRIRGHSMEPILKPGDEVLTVQPNLNTALIKEGVIVVADHPHHPQIVFIKRVDHILADGSLFLLGDNLNQSSDSRTYGPFRPEWVRGVVVKRFG